MIAEEIPKMSIQERQNSKQMEPIETAPPIVELSQAHRWLPMSRTSVYNAANAGLIQVQKLPYRRYVTKAELRRIRGEELPPVHPEPTRPPRYRYPRLRSSGRSN
jgi:hypothetical protein